MIKPQEYKINSPIAVNMVRMAEDFSDAIEDVFLMKFLSRMEALLSKEEGLTKGMDGILMDIILFHKGKKEEIIPTLLNISSSPLSSFCNEVTVDTWGQFFTINLLSQTLDQQYIALSIDWVDSFKRNSFKRKRERLLLESLNRIYKSEVECLFDKYEQRIEDAYQQYIFAEHI